MSTSNEPARIVVTGGPCAGKSTGLRYLVEHLSARGFRALVVPEAATMLITGGVHDIGDLAAHNRDAYLVVQKNLLRLQAALREQYVALARDLTTCDVPCDDDCENVCHGTHLPNHKKPHAEANCPGHTRAVVLFDRAELDNRAYMNSEEFSQVLRDATGRSAGEVSAEYDAVIHMVTAASLIYGSGIFSQVAPKASCC